VNYETQTDDDPAPIQSDAVPDQEFYILRLYVAGQISRSMAALANLKKICEEHLGSGYKIEIIDLLENPQLARSDISCPNAG
jgi:circadian clock protein KaiB